MKPLDEVRPVICALYERFFGPCADLSFSITEHYEYVVSKGGRSVRIRRKDIDDLLDPPADAPRRKKAEATILYALAPLNPTKI